MSQEQNQKKEDAADLAGSIAQHSDPGNLPLVVLAVDDDPAILKFYGRAFGAMGVRLECTTDPRHTLDLVAKTHPNLVILDLAMPGVKGMALLYQIREQATATRVAIITGEYSIATAMQAMQAGAIEYVCKPVSPDKLHELLEKVRRLIADEPGTSPRDSAP
jgi:DNA-binding NtrC family response regulator